MSFRYRLALFLVVTLAAVQLLTALVAYSYLRNSLVDQAKTELTTATDVFQRQLRLLSSVSPTTCKSCRSITHCARRLPSAITIPNCRRFAITATVSARPV